MERSDKGQQDLEGLRDVPFGLPKRQLCMVTRDVDSMHQRLWTRTKTVSQEVGPR